MPFPVSCFRMNVPCHEPHVWLEIQFFPYLNFKFNSWHKYRRKTIEKVEEMIERKSRSLKENTQPFSLFWKGSSHVVIGFRLVSLSKDNQKDDVGGEFLLNGSCRGGVGWEGDMRRKWFSWNLSLKSKVIVNYWPQREWQDLCQDSFKCSSIRFFWSWESSAIFPNTVKPNLLGKVRETSKESIADSKSQWKNSYCGKVWKLYRESEKYRNNSLKGRWRPSKQRQFYQINNLLFSGCKICKCVCFS